MQTECEEVAGRLLPPPDAKKSYDAMCAWVREQMPEESYTVRENVSWSLWKEHERRNVARLQHWIESGFLSERYLKVGA